jgi:putative FmdB family regulatory protein
MPIYEYRCQAGHTFEVMQRMSDDPVSSCQTCAAPVQRVFHPVAVHFKGSGFYNTDYGTRKRAREKADGDGGAPSEAGGGEKSKPESATSKPDSTTSKPESTTSKPGSSTSGASSSTAKPARAD